MSTPNEMEPACGLSNHTGKELELMMERKKPLAMFYDGADLSDEESVIPEAVFDPFVDRGEFSKGIEVFELAIDPRTRRPCRVKYVLYALAEEEWRIQAMFLALRTMIRMGGADEGIDRIMGALLGYEESEIERFINSKR